MIARSTDWALALFAGALLALLVNYNSLLAHHTTATFASWVAHGVGAVVALALALLPLRTGRAAPAAAAPTPRWFYLGGIPGALTVILAAITVNGGLTLSGTIALMLVGQVLFGLVSDSLGLLRTPRRRIGGIDLLVAVAVLAGSALIIYGGP